MPIFKALSVTERRQKTPLTFLDYEEPKLEEGEFLVQNVAVAQNPTDWKTIDGDRIPELPWVVGGDIAGTVYKVGSGVKQFEVGDRVIAFLSRKSARHGGYQTYTIAEVNRSVKLPESYSFEAGSTIPLAYTTAAAGLAHALGVKLPDPDALKAPDSKNEPLLVWGGSSSVGAYIIQIAYWAGYTVISTASKQHHEYVKSLGAKFVFDYHDENVVSQIRTTAGPNLSKVYDAISLPASAIPALNSITSPDGGKYAAILPVSPDLSPSPSIKIIQTGAIEAFNTPEIGKKAYKLLQGTLNQGIFKPNHVLLFENGLNDVDKGFELGRKEKISGQKPVYRIADSKF